ncbi:transglutaminase-like cysteine peptidase [Phyllobacterium bourgognense]|uniref:Putative transglutaminase-like cysteine proteinase n=1 Tax=Phyllobacterium bourgognense TaxID=314236 RepID=A0A368YWC6_9HYPH|nr:transglutaminase-like cysteine peptidase [Phyllobacterium bourgognense]RCW84473.1 putative transglutaminase-like cysteine proteinase [Phyllobacterium bourgognense]
MLGVAGVVKAMGFAVALVVGTLGTNSAFASEAFMTTGGLTSQPIGHYEFCKRLPEECSIRSRNVMPEKMNHDFWQLIVNVNSNDNHKIKPLTDMEIYGVEEYWAYPDKVGDCEDYVLLKRRDLMQSGISPANLLITVVRKPDGEGHAVLTVRTDKGDFVLDNLVDGVKNWSETPYTYLKRQATNNSGRWVSIEAPTNILVGSVQ